MAVASDGATVEAAAQELHRSLAGVSSSQAKLTVDRAVAQLRADGLIGRAAEIDPPQDWPGSSFPADRRSGIAHPILDRSFVFRSADAGLLRTLEDLFEASDPESAPSIALDVDRLSGGEILLQAANTWRFPSEDAFIHEVVEVVNEYAARSCSMPVLHAAAVRTPDGRILVLPGRVDAGKSTLAAALVRAGADYLGDESIGVGHLDLEAFAYPKPISLDSNGWRVVGLGGCPTAHVSPREIRSDVALLSGAVGRVSEIVLPEHNPTDAPSRTRLTPREALRAVLSNTLNLARSGEAGLATLCRLAEEVPITRIVHHDAVDLASELMASGASAPWLADSE